ncbi:MAG: ABC transporter permease [Candidatus Vecturithrix sp.]|jgi:peptide/nickel transport system permease protein|nr:ABC transporter permease [Candidatus Vecturithrix sp.]
MRVFRDLLQNDHRFLIGIIILSLVLLLALLSFFSPYAPEKRRVVKRNEPVSWQHPLGGNALGQDIFWKLTFAVRNSLLLGVLAALCSRIFAMANGLISGYAGGRTDRILSTLTDSFIVIPRLPILILFSFALKTKISLFSIGLMLAALDWAWPSKRYRAQVLSLRERGFTYTSVFSGSNIFQIVLKEHFPFLIPYMMADFISGFLWAIAMEITLSVLGLSALTTPTIGTMIYWANYYQALLRGTWRWILPPIFASILTVISFYLISISMSEFLDPRTRLQRIKVKG